MLSALVLSSLVANASSHRESPAMSQDPSADLTDFYAFVSPEDSTKTVFIMNVNPESNPGGGPNYNLFDEDAAYDFNIDNEGDGVADVVMRFEFRTEYQLPNDFLYNVGDISVMSNLNIIQTYAVTRIDLVTGQRFKLLQGTTDAGLSAPANPGTQSDPGMGYDPYDPTGGQITVDHIKLFSKGGHDFKAFAGPRQDPFYIDLARTFDLLNLVGNDPGANHNTLLGFNVSTIAIEVDSSLLTSDGMAPDADNSVIAAWATVSRQKFLNRSEEGEDLDIHTGKWVQVSRLGMPLVNEVVIPIMDKDRFNASEPVDDIQFASYVLDPILMVYLNAVLGVPDPGCYSAGFGLGCREDLVQVFLTGHPAFGNEFPGFVLGGPIPSDPSKSFAAFEALRLDLTNPASGFPNGRLPGDDVMDTGLSVVVGLLINGATLSDGVDSTGLTYLDVFPFLGDPWAGDDHPMNVHDL